MSSIVINTTGNAQVYNLFSIPSGETGLAYTFSPSFSFQPALFTQLQATGVSGAFIEDFVYDVNELGFSVAFNFAIPNENYQYGVWITPSGSPFGFSTPGMEYLAAWSTGIWMFGLNEPTNISALSISGWAASSYVVGKLNTLLQECHSGLSGYVYPPYNTDELGVLEKMYMANYYGILARSAVGGNNLVSTKDGDAAITLANPAIISKNFLEAAKEANLELNYLANVYRGNDALPRSVNFYYILFNDWQGANYWGNQGYVG